LFTLFNEDVQQACRLSGAKRKTEQRAGRVNIMKMFNKLAAYYDLMFREDYSMKARVVYSILNGLGVKSGHLLDVGCGTGNHLREFRLLGFSVEGLDSSIEMLRLARAKLPNVVLHKARMEWMRLGLGFDVITLLSRTLLFVKNYFWLKVVLKRLFNHLNPDGVLIMDLDIHDLTFSPELSSSNYFHEGKIEGSLMEDYELNKGKILWSANLSIKEGSELIRTVDNQEYLLINVHKLMILMRDVGFRVKIYDVNGVETTNHKQALIFACIK